MAETERKQKCSKMREVFTNCQSGHHSQASLIKALTKLYEVEDTGRFFADFISHVKYFLIVFKREPAVERAVDFIAKFSTSLQSSSELNGEEAVDKENSKCQEDVAEMHPFLLQLFKFLLENHNARDKAVRFRVCQLINRLLSSLGDDAAIDDELYEKIYTSLQSRLRDKFPVVRVHAVLALARLQDPSDPDCPIIAAFKYMLEYDVNADVRRAVLSAIAATTRTLLVMLDRTRDVKDTVRRLSYQILSEKVHVRALTIAQRVRVLRQGLNDRAEGVKESCSTLLVKAWLDTYSGDKLTLLGLLDVENSLDITQLLLNVLFSKSTPDELTTGLEILDDTHVIRIDRLTCESAVYWRCLCEHLRSLGAVGDEFLDRIMPSGVAYAKFLRSIMERAKNELQADELLKTEFILQQLVGLIAVMDLSDEVNRKQIIQVLHDLLLSDCVTHSIVSCVLGRYSQLHTDSDTFVASVAEIISDIREPITVVPQTAGKEERRQVELKLAAIRVQLNQVRDELEECVQKQEFQKAAELKQEVARLEASRQALVVQSQPQNNETRLEKTDPQTLLKCLSLLSELLTEARFKKLTPSLQTLIEVLILPGIQNADPAVRNLAVKALGLCCLRSVDLARERIILLLQISRMDQETVKLTALKQIFDLLHFFGIEVFKVDLGVDETGAADRKDDETKEDVSNDFDDLNSENDSEPQQPEKQNYGVDILTILTDLLDSNSSEVRTLCAEGFTKLLIAGRIVSPSLLSRLLLLWYNPLTEDDTRLRHCIGTFLPVYAFGSRQNQELIADAIMPTLQALFDAPSTSPLAEVKVANVAELLVELTDVRRQITTGKHKDSSLVDKTPHDDIAVKMANEILSNPNSFNARILVKTLCSLNLTPSSESTLKDLRVLCKRMLKEIKDKQCARPLEKFTRSVRDMLQQLKTEGCPPGRNLSQTESDNEMDLSRVQQNGDANASSVLGRTLNNTKGKSTTPLKGTQKAMKKLMSRTRLSPGGDDCPISDFDTENDDLFVSPRQQPQQRAAAAASSLLTSKALDTAEAQISEDSDFETQSRPSRASARTRCRHFVYGGGCLSGFSVLEMAISSQCLQRNALFSSPFISLFLLPDVKSPQTEKTRPLMQALPGDPMPEEQALDTLSAGVPLKKAVHLLVEDGGWPGWRDITATHYPDPVNLRQISSQIDSIKAETKSIGRSFQLTIWQRTATVSVTWNCRTQRWL